MNRATQERRKLRQRGNPEHLAARRARYKPGSNLAASLRKYSLTVGEYEAMLAEQDGKCHLCGEAPDPDGIKAASRLHVDHDHVTGKVRRLLCNRCNMGLGYLRDNPKLMRLAADYVEAHAAT